MEDNLTSAYSVLLFTTSAALTAFSVRITLDALQYSLLLKSYKRSNGKSSKK